MVACCCLASLLAAPQALTISAKDAAPAGPVVFAAKGRWLPRVGLFRMDKVNVAVQRIADTDRWVALAPALPAGSKATLGLSAQGAVNGATAETTAEGVAFRVGKELVTILRTAGASRPYCFPVHAPGGAMLTEDAPADHPHHRSLWFAHGKVDGVDFWSQGPKAGTTIAKSVELSAGPAFAEARCAVEWVARDGRVIAKDIRRYRVYALAEPFVMDFEIELTSAGPSLSMGDDKEGMFGVRVAKSIAVDSRQGGKLVNAVGQADAAAWGQPAAWCDYFGPTDKGMAGVAILDHPSNVRHPTAWHARTYGLFCANPFGLQHFNKKNPDGTLRSWTASESTMVVIFDAVVLVPTIK